MNQLFCDMEQFEEKLRCFLKNKEWHFVCGVVWGMVV